MYSKKDSTKVGIDDWIQQLKIFFNSIFGNNRETMRRAVKMNYQNKFYLKDVWFTDENHLMFGQWIYDQLMSEQGVDPDAHLDLYSQYALSDEQMDLKTINKKIYSQMKQLVEPHVLNSYF